MSMLAKFRRYQKVIFVAIIVIIVPSFVVIVSQVSDVKLWGQLFKGIPGVGSFFADEPQAAAFGSMKGRPFKQEEANMARNEVQLGYYLRYGRWPTSEDDRALKRDLLSRLFLIEKAKELGIHPSEKAVGLIMREHIGEMPREQFERDHLAQAKLGWGDYERFAVHEAAIRQLYQIGGLSGKLVDPKEAAELFRKAYEEFNAVAAVFWASNYLGKANVTPEDVAKFYTNHMSSYGIPERVQVSYVSFPATNFYADADKRMAEITNLEANITKFYFEKGTNAFKDADGKVMSEAAAKAKLKEDMRRQSALQSAHRKAAEFGNELFELSQTNSLAKFEKLAAAKGLPVQVTPPLEDKRDGLSDTNFPPELIGAAFKLLVNTNEPIYFRPIIGDNAAYMIAFNKRIPREIPPLEKVRDKVTAECKLDRAGELARKDGTNFAILVFTNQVPGKTFDDLAAQMKVPVVKLPPISRATSELTNVDERLRLEDLEGQVFGLEPGRSGRFFSTLDGGWVMHLNSRTPVSDAKLSEELPKFMATLRQNRHYEAFNQWFTKQAELAQLTGPPEPTNPPPRAPSQRTPPPAPKATK